MYMTAPPPPSSWPFDICLWHFNKTFNYLQFYSLTRILIVLATNSCNLLQSLIALHLFVLYRFPFSIFFSLIFFHQITYSGLLTAAVMNRSGGSHSNWHSYSINVTISVATTKLLRNNILIWPNVFVWLQVTWLKVEKGKFFEFINGRNPPFRNSTIEGAEIDVSRRKLPGGKSKGS